MILASFVSSEHGKMLIIGGRTWFRRGVSPAASFTSENGKVILIETTGIYFAWSSRCRWEINFKEMWAGNVTEDYSPISDPEEIVTGRGRFVIQEVELREGKRFGRKGKSTARWWEILEVPETDAEWFERHRESVSRLRADHSLEAIEGLYTLKPLVDEIEEIGRKLQNEK